MSTLDEYLIALDARKEGREADALAILDGIDQVAYVRASWKRTVRRPDFTREDYDEDNWGYGRGYGNAVAVSRPATEAEALEERLRIKTQWAQTPWTSWHDGPNALSTFDAILREHYSEVRVGSLGLNFAGINVVADSNVPRDRMYVMPTSPATPSTVYMSPTNYEAFQRQVTRQLPRLDAARDRMTDDGMEARSLRYTQMLPTQPGSEGTFQIEWSEK